MFGSQQAALVQARLEHARAVADMRSARDEFQKQRTAFVARPANLLFPFTAGILIAASQWKSVPKGVGGLPFMSIAKSAVGAYALVARIKAIQQE